MKAISKIRILLGTLCAVAAIMFNTCYAHASYNGKAEQKSNKFSICTSYKIIFNKNNEQATGTMNPQIMMMGKQENLNENQFASDLHTFLGWALAADGDVVFEDKDLVSSDILKAKGVTVKSGSEVNLYAKWEEKKYKINYDANTGYGVKNGETFFFCYVEIGWSDATKQVKDCMYQKDGFEFDGWSLTADGSQKVYNNQTIDNKDSKTILGTFNRFGITAPGGEVTLYATWKSNYDDMDVFYVISGESGKGGDATHTHTETVNNKDTNYQDKTTTTTQTSEKPAQGTTDSGLYHFKNVGSDYKKPNEVNGASVSTYEEVNGTQK